MAEVNRITGNLRVLGTITPTTMAYPPGSIVNADVSSAAGITVDKVQHQYQAGFSQPNSAATTETHAIYTVYGATATILAFKAGSIAKAVGDSTVTVDLKKNGTTCLSAVITLDNANTNRVVEAGTLSVTSAVAGDLLEIVITATIGTGTLPTGVFGYMEIKEDAS